MHSQELVQAEATLKDLHHSGENKPHMWWAKFECKMNSACSAIRHGAKNVMDEQTEIQNLLSKIKDPSLEHVHSSINREVVKNPNHTHLDATRELKTEILRKHPNACDTDENPRRVKQTAAAKKHQNHEHQNKQQNKEKNHHPDAKTIISKNGKKTKCHHSFRFDDDDWQQFSHQQRKTLFNERRSAKKSNARNNKQPDHWKKELKQEGDRIVKSLMSQLKDSVTGSIVSEITQQNNTPPAGLPSSIVGGRNSLARNKGGRTE